jgi:hypothetical protein
MLDNYRDLIDELLGTPSTLRTLLGGEGMPAPDVARLIAELRDRDRAVLDRLQRLTREREPYLTPLTSAEPEVPVSRDELLQGFDAARSELVSMLMNLTLRDWERVGLEPDGEVRLADEVERHVEFDEDHLAQIQAALAS